MILSPLIPLVAQTTAPQATPAPDPDPLLVDETTLTFTDEPGAAVANNPTNLPSSDLGFWDFFRMILVLAAVVGLVYVFILFLRKISGQPSRPNGLIKVLHTQILQGTRALHVVEVAGEYLVVGTGDSVTLIKEIHDQEAIDQIRLEASREIPKSGNFLSRIQSFLRKPLDNSSVAPETSSTTPDFLKKQRDRLKNL